MMNPIANRITPAISLPVPNFGWFHRVTFGEFNMVTGRETSQTQNIWKIQKPRKEKNLSLLSSNRESLPVLRILKRRKPARRVAQSIMKSETTICLAF